MRAVLDPNVVISALISSSGSPARVLKAWFDGAFELVISPNLLSELRRALAYPKLSTRITSEEAAEMLELLRLGAEMHEDPQMPPLVHSSDPGDDYLIALAAEAGAILVSGDKHLLELPRIPVESPSAFLQRVDS